MCVKFVGALLVAAGVWAFAEKNRLGLDGTDFNSIQAKYVSVFSVVFDLTVLVIVLGMVIFVLAFAGCIGALRENICLLKAVTVLLDYCLLLMLILLS